MIPSNVSTGRVEGRYIADVIDGPDPDQEPDAVPAQGRLVFTKSVAYLPNPTAQPAPVTIMQVPIVGVLDGEGYLCTPAPGTLDPLYRGVKLIATDDPDIAVQNWTWDVTYIFEPFNGHKLAIPAHGFALPSGETVDLTKVAKVPSSPGYSLPQAEAAVLRAEAAALASSEEAALALLAAERAEQVAGATDEGVALLLGDVETVAGFLLDGMLAPKADAAGVAEALSLKADSAAVSAALDDKANASAVSAALASKVDTNALATKADLTDGKVPVAQLPTDALVTDSNVAQQVGAPQTGAAIDARVSAQVTPMVEQVAADYIASNPAVVDAAAAAVDANPKIATIEAALPWRGRIPDGTDLNTLRTPGVWAIATTTSAATLTNLPVPYSGIVKVWQTAGTNVWTQEFSGSGSLTNPENYTRITRSTTTWGAWEPNREAKGPIPVGTNLATFRASGYWVITNASAVTGLPALTGNIYAVLHVVALPSVISAVGSQTLRVYASDGSYRIFERVAISTTFPAWEEKGVPAPAPATASSDAGLTNSLLIQDWSRRMGGRKKVTTATVAFRFDHGLANFNTKVRAELDSRNFKYSLALCSGQWDRAENAGVTPAMVNAWVVAKQAEIWNHSKDHGSGDNSEAAWKAAILDGLTELRAQLPAAQIDGFAPPGSSGTNFGGFINGATMEEFYNTDGGKFILSHHAVSAGYIGPSTRWQDGTPRQGLAHYTLDTYTLAQVQTIIQGAQAGKRAVQFMLHPSLLDTADKITAATFVSILDYVQGEVTAGRLNVVSPYEQLLTDAV